ncbi:hypothetical protein [Frankia sp. CiP3]|uniref:hypothetical protein n=1 Tax=Frankia sp. CiP3 TaxID=2880971 RepID=UPI001EF53A48|nr:hypothetical protein [Frankia sp. CiP3]
MQNLVVEIAAGIAADVRATYPGAAVIDVAVDSDEQEIELVAVCAFAGEPIGDMNSDRFENLASRIEPDLNWIRRLALEPDGWHPSRLDLTATFTWYRCVEEPTVRWFPDLGSPVWVRTGV